MKIKTFEFVVNIWCGSVTSPSLLMNDSHNENERRLNLVNKFCSSTKDMDKIINHYLELELKNGRKFISLSENYHTTNHPNNGGEDKIIRYVTIITD